MNALIQEWDKMMERGLLEEVKQLFELRHLNALQTVGYQELFNHLEGHSKLEEAIELIKRNSRRYAKRQLTWTRRDKFWKLIRPQDFEMAVQYIDLATRLNLQIIKFLRPEDVLVQQFFQRNNLSTEVSWKDSFIGLLQEEELIGLLQFQESKSKAILSNLVVDPKYQQLERILIHEGTCFAEEKGIPLIINSTN